MIQILIQYSYMQLVHAYAYAEPKQRPKWAKTTLQDVRYVVGDPTDIRRTLYDFEGHPFALTTTELMPPRGSIFISTVLWRGCWKSLLGILHAGGVQLPPREPDLASGSPSFRKETC
jgi:hypothetical protein